MIDGAIYHLTEDTWIIPALQSNLGPVSLTDNHTRSDTTSDAAIDTLVSTGRPADDFHPRTHAHIMHNKFLVRVGDNGTAEAVLTGSANFTPEGLSAQANLLHTFESADLAALYLNREEQLSADPTLAATQRAQTGWSDPLTVGDATIRVFFPPEPKDQRASLDTIVAAINTAQHSVLLCAFDPTDAALLDAVFAASDAGKMMLALVNRVPTTEPSGDPSRADVAAEIAIMNRAEKDHDITTTYDRSGPRSVGELVETSRGGDPVDARPEGRRGQGQRRRRGDRDGAPAGHVWCAAGPAPGARA